VLVGEQVLTAMTEPCCALFKVADVCVEALVVEQAKNKVVEIIAEQTQPTLPIRVLFSSVY